MSSSENLAAADARHWIHPCHDADLQADGIIWRSGQGATLTDIHGRELLDGISGLWNVLIGHGRRELAETAADQMSRLAFASTYSGSGNVPAIRLAERLAGLCYPRINRFYFTTSGAEANEAALKTARYFWKRAGRPEKIHVITRRGDYHGTTFAALSATGLEKYTRMFAPMMPGFSAIEAPPHADAICGNANNALSGIPAAKLLEQEIQRVGPENVAAFIAEPIIGVGGVYVPPDDYWPRIRQICDEHDVLLIADEVITGFGRTGEWFALRPYNIEPDIVTFAKGITSGYLPLGGMGVSDEIGETIAGGRGETAWLHAATSSGHPVACAVAMTNIDLIKREELLPRAKEMEGRLGELLLPMTEHPLVSEVRGRGLLFALQLQEDKSKGEHARGQGFHVLVEARRRGLFSRARHDLFHLAPCLTVEPETLERMVAILAEALDAVADR